MSGTVLAYVLALVTVVAVTVVDIVTGTIPELLATLAVVSFGGALGVSVPGGSGKPAAAPVAAVVDAPPPPARIG